MEFDFSGYATKNDLRCSDGRIIRRDAFKENDGMKVPLVWQHMYDEPANILGHAHLENREDGVYAYAKLNQTAQAINAKELIQHGDITALSIYANKLIQKGDEVLHGVIREVSLVLTGANPEAFIDNVVMAHGDGSIDVSANEAIIYTGLGFQLKDDSDVQHADEEKEEPQVAKTYEEIWEGMTDEQKDLVAAMLEQAILNVGDEEEEEEAPVEHSEELPTVEETEEETEEIQHKDEGENIEMKKNIFENDVPPVDEQSLSHSDVRQIFDTANRTGSLKEAFLAHAATYGIEDVDKLFPEAKLVDGMPALISRDMEWVDEVMKGIKHSPFARIKSTAIDITEEEARAKGYSVKGEIKYEEVIKALKRTTTPTTVYKKQKLDRDDILDITDLDVVAWIKREMRMMLEEELARAYLIGDGRDVVSDDKIDETSIRPIYTDNVLYSHKVEIDNADILDAIDDIIRARKHYKGSGRPVLFTTEDFLTEMLLAKDELNRYIYTNEVDLATKLRVSKIVEVPVMTGVERNDGNKDLDLVGIIVNLKDYVVGADRGGQLSMFDDFDIDYNQYKYLIETRCSGALVIPKSALVLEMEKGGDLNP